MPKIGNKNALSGLFWARILKDCCHSCIEHPEDCLIAKFCLKQKFLILGHKMTC